MEKGTFSSCTHPLLATSGDHHTLALKHPLYEISGHAYLLHIPALSYCTVQYLRCGSALASCYAMNTGNWVRTLTIIPHEAVWIPFVKTQKVSLVWAEGEYISDQVVYHDHVKWLVRVYSLVTLCRNFDFYTVHVYTDAVYVLQSWLVVTVTVSKWSK